MKTSEQTERIDQAFIKANTDSQKPLTMDKQKGGNKKEKGKYLKKPFVSLEETKKEINCKMCSQKVLPKADSKCTAGQTRFSLKSKHL